MGQKHQVLTDGRVSGVCRRVPVGRLVGLEGKCSALCSRRPHVSLGNIVSQIALIPLILTASYHYIKCWRAKSRQALCRDDPCGVPMLGGYNTHVPTNNLTSLLVPVGCTTFIGQYIVLSTPTEQLCPICW